MHQAFKTREIRRRSAGVLPGALGPDLGKQERTPSRQTTAGIPTTQQRDRDGPYRWSGAGSGADADDVTPFAGPVPLRAGG